MKQLVRAIFPKEFFDSPEYFRALWLAGLYVVLVVMQLFRFEKLLPIVESFRLPGGTIVAAAVTVLLPLLEIAALPYLLSMRISERVWRISRVAVLSVPLLLFAVYSYLELVGNKLVESGLFGATISLYYGWWALLLVTMLVISAGIVVRDMPRR